MDMIVHDRPDEAILAKSEELEEIRKAQGDKVYWALVREVLKTDPWFLMRIALEWAWLDEGIVGRELLNHIGQNYGSDLAILLPRGHGKTLPMAGFVVFSIIRNPNIAILQVSRIDDRAKEFGQMVGKILLENDYLQRCFGTKYNTGANAILPSSISECSSWGDDGFVLPNRKPRIDHTLKCISINSAKAGRHPDWIYVDDPTEEENNNPQGWQKTEKAIDGLSMTLPASGFFIWTGTRWHDGDPLGKVENGKIIGKQGRFKILKKSCYIDDNPLKGPTYPKKLRWNMEASTGYTLEALNEQRLAKGAFFDAQMRNDPLPAERADIKVSNIVIYEREQVPKLGPISFVGIEVTGGGRPIYTGLQEFLEQSKINMPLIEINNPHQRGTTKKDRIVAALQPIVDRGGLYASKWMIGDSSSLDNLGYELRRLGVASHDDIADALHNIPAFLAKGLKPRSPEDPADLYISVDLAWTEEKKADWTVILAAAVDHKGDIWVLDYDRFQTSSPSGIYLRILSFYRKWEEQDAKIAFSNKKFPGAWR